MRRPSNVVRRATLLSLLAVGIVGAGTVPAAAHYRATRCYEDCDGCYVVLCDCYRVRCHYDDGDCYPQRERIHHRVGYTEGYGQGYPYYGDNSYPDGYHRPHEWRERDGE